MTRQATEPQNVAGAAREFVPEQCWGSGDYSTDSTVQYMDHEHVRGSAEWVNFGVGPGGPFLTKVVPRTPTPTPTPTLPNPTI
jgi:hypothetical protein